MVPQTTALQVQQATAQDDSITVVAAATENDVMMEMVEVVVDGEDTAVEGVQAKGVYVEGGNDSERGGCHGSGM